VFDREYTLHIKQGRVGWIWLLGDIGYGGNRFSADSFRRDMEWAIRKKEKGCSIKIISPGDCLAAPSPSERAAIYSAKGGKGFYDTTSDALDELYRGRADDFVKFMRPFKDDFWGLSDGHHAHAFSNRHEFRGNKTEWYLARCFKADHWGQMGYIGIRVPECGALLSAVVHHGYGGERTEGAKLQKRITALAAFPCDFIIMGHDNSRLAATVARLFRGETGVQSRDSRVVGIGAYEMAYERGATDGYVEAALMSPTALGATFLRLENYKGRLHIRALV